MRSLFEALLIGVFGFCYRSQATKGKLILLVEGHLIFNIAPIAELCSKKYFMTVSKEVGRLRRSTRRYKRYDARYFDKYAWPLYEYYRKNAFDTFTDLVVLNGDLDLKVNESRILSDVSALCKSFECIVCGGIVFTFYFQYYCTLPWLEIFDIGWVFQMWSLSNKCAM